MRSPGQPEAHLPSWGAPTGGPRFVARRLWSRSLQASLGVLSRAMVSRPAREERSTLRIGRRGLGEHRGGVVAGRSTPLKIERSPRPRRATFGGGGTRWQRKPHGLGER